MNIFSRCHKQNYETVNEHNRTPLINWVHWTVWTVTYLALTRMMSKRKKMRKGSACWR